MQHGSGDDIHQQSNRAENAHELRLGLVEALRIFWPGIGWVGAIDTATAALLLKRLTLEPLPPSIDWNRW